VAIQNVWSQAAGIQPRLDAPAEEILAKIIQNGDTYTALFTWVALNSVLLMIFLGGAYARLQTDEPMWTAVGVVGGVLLAGFFALANVPTIALAIGGSSLAGSPVLVDLLWDMHLATFAFAELALGVALFGLSLASLRAGLVPAWFRIVGPAGAAMLIAGAVPVKAVAQGVPATMVSLLGFVVWLLFLGVLGFRMWREGGAALRAARLAYDSHHAS
jgi:hypothetical protein